MRKIVAALLAVVMLLGTTAMADITITGTSKGFGGPVTVTATLSDTFEIVEFTVEGPNETKGIGTPALEQLPAKMIEAGSFEVDVIAGATVTSQAIMRAAMYAMNTMLGLEPTADEAAPVVMAPGPVVYTGDELYHGLGVSTMGRVGPGKDATDTQVYSFNVIAAYAIFDAEGRIQGLEVDQLEVATPNYDGETMPHFSGFPGQGGYNWDEQHDKVIAGKTPDTDEFFLEEISGWRTKRERGDEYVMTTGMWYQQMDKFEELFLGMTVEEIEDWFVLYCSDRNGRPLKDGSTNEVDAAKYNALSDEDKAMLADVTTAATMSLNDSHGNIIEAIVKASENHVPLDASDVGFMGIGIDSMGRVGPGKDATDTQVYSFNIIVAATLTQDDYSIASVLVDQVEVATPNYDGETMPHFSGYPGQGGYNWDENHDKAIPGKTEDTDENFLLEVASWATKRERGNSYVMGTGTWWEQMDRFQQLFVGMTFDDIYEWFTAFTSDRNGRPLKDGSTNEADAAKYNALSDEDKAMLADVTSAATMSLNDSHGDITTAIYLSILYSAPYILNAK